MPFSDPKVHAAFDPDTIALMAASLDAAWAELSAAEQTQTSKFELAERILQAAARGERDAVRLKAAAALIRKVRNQDAAE